MNTQEALRKEIEIRLIRETVYRAVDALNTKAPLAEHIASNDKHIALLGEFLRTARSDADLVSWERFYAERTK